MEIWAYRVQGSRSWFRVPCLAGPCCASLVDVPMARGKSAAMSRGQECEHHGRGDSGHSCRRPPGNETVCTGLKNLFETLAAIFSDCQIPPPANYGTFRSDMES